MHILAPGMNGRTFQHHGPSASIPATPSLFEFDTESHLQRQGADQPSPEGRPTLNGPPGDTLLAVASRDARTV